MIGTKLNRYTIVSDLGTGGMCDRNEQCANGNCLGNMTCN